MVDKTSHTLNLTRRLLDQARIILGSINVNVKPKNHLTADELYKIFLHIYTNIAWQLAFGVYYCCKYGFGIAGIGAARSIYEMFITLRYIEQDKDARLGRFFDHTAVIRKLEVDALTAAGESVPGKVRNHRLSEFNQVKKRYQKAKPSFKKYWWAGIDIEKMAEDIKWTKNHTLIYGRLSTIAHISATELDAHLKYTNGSKEEIHIYSELSPGSKYSEDALVVVLGYFPGILDLCLKVWGIKPSPDLEGICREIQALY